MQVSQGQANHAELKQRFGSKVIRKHLIALNRLTLLAHEGPFPAESGQVPISYNSLASLPIELRHVNRGLLEADFNGTSEQSQWM